MISKTAAFYTVPITCSGQKLRTVTILHSEIYPFIAVVEIAGIIIIICPVLPTGALFPHVLLDYGIVLLKGPQSASAIFNDIEIIDIAW